MLCGRKHDDSCPFKNNPLLLVEHPSWNLPSLKAVSCAGQFAVLKQTSNFFVDALDSFDPEGHDDKDILIVPAAIVYFQIGRAFLVPGPVAACLATPSKVFQKRLEELGSFALSFKEFLRNCAPAFAAQTLWQSKKKIFLKLHAV